MSAKTFPLVFLFFTHSLIHNPTLLPPSLCLPHSSVASWHTGTPPDHQPVNGNSVEWHSKQLQRKKKKKNSTAQGILLSVCGPKEYSLLFLYRQPNHQFALGETWTMPAIIRAATVCMKKTYTVTVVCNKLSLRIDFIVSVLSNYVWYSVVISPDCGWRWPCLNKGKLSYCLSCKVI